VGRASLRFAAGHNLGREKPVNADFLPAFLALARSQKKRQIARQTPRVSITIRRTALAKRRLGRERAQTFFRLERRSTRDRAEFQILSRRATKALRDARIILCCSRSHQGSLAEILLARSHLGGLKLLPCIPRALPILFLSPTLRFQEMKIGRGVGLFVKMTSGEKRVI